MLKNTFGLPQRRGHSIGMLLRPPKRYSRKPSLSTAISRFHLLEPAYHLHPRILKSISVWIWPNKYGACS